jgi:hypothetical protein
LKLDTTVVLSDDKRKALLAPRSEIVAETIGKPEQCLMATISPAVIVMSSKAGDAAFVDARSIDVLRGDLNRQLSQKAVAPAE